MLEFNDEHKSIKGSLKKNDNKIKVKNAIICGLTILSLCLFSGCAKNVDCSIEDLHAHVYTNEASFSRHVISEREHIGEFFRTDDYVIIDKQMSDLIEFENDEGLFKIEENLDTIQGIVSVKEDYTEYRYSYITLVSVPHVVSTGKGTTVTYTHVPVTKYSWTSDANHPRLTGEQRTVHHMYKGCMVTKNKKGEFEIIESNLVENILDLPGEYEYVTEDFCIKVDQNGKAIDYEDGKEEDQEVQLSEEEQIQYESQLQESNIDNTPSLDR